MLHVVARTGRDVDKINVMLIEHVTELTEHPRLGEIVQQIVPTVLDNVTRPNQVKQSRMLTKNRIVIGIHRSSAAHDRDLQRWTLIVSDCHLHFFTISVIAERNCATSLN